MPDNASAPRRVRLCPVCSKPATREAWPFCSQRCRDVDLHRWLSGSYVIPGRADDEDTSG